MYKILALTISLFLSGCIGERQYTPIAYYDFGHPQLFETKLNIDNINSEGPYKERFVSRKEGNLLAVEEYNRWAQAPDLLLSHYLKQSFQPGSLYFLEGELLTIEHDLTKKKALFKAIYSISKEGRTLIQKNFQRSVETNGSVNDFVEKISLSVKEFTSEISKEVSKLK